MKRRSCFPVAAAPLLVISSALSVVGPIISVSAAAFQHQLHHRQYLHDHIDTRCTVTGFRAQQRQSLLTTYGWLDNCLPKPYDAEADAEADAKRRLEYPEQYPATYDLLPSTAILPSDCDDAAYVRPFLKQTQLESRPLKLVYDANVHGWAATSFHSKVDACGAAVVLAKTIKGEIVGGYNPKGWSGLGGARPSVAAFLFYADESSGKIQKLRKVGGGGLACGSDEPNAGIYFGPDGLIIPLQPGARERVAQSKLGPYFERGPDELSSVLRGGVATLKELKVMVGVYSEGEEIPYSGAVLDMTSG